MSICHGYITLVAVQRPWMAIVVDGNHWFAAAEGESTLCTLLGELVEEALIVVCVEWTWHWRFRSVHESLLGGTSLTELEDAAANRAAVKGGGVT